MRMKPNDVARKIASKHSDIQGVALFNSAKQLIAYAIPPGIHEIEQFRTKAQKRIIITLCLLMFVALVNIKTPVLWAAALIYIGGNTLFGWDKFQTYCHSTFTFNIAITVIAYSLSLYYAFPLSATNIAIKTLIVTQYIQITPLIILFFLISITGGYILSKKYVGYIDTLPTDALESMTLTALAKNHDIEKYVLTENGDYNRLIIKKSHTATAKNKRVQVQAAQNMGKLKK